MNSPNLRPVVVDAGVVADAVADDCDGVGVGVVPVGRIGSVVVPFLGIVLFRGLAIAIENARVGVAVGPGRRMTMMTRGDLMPQDLHGSLRRGSRRRCGRLRDGRHRRDFLALRRRSFVRATTPVLLRFNNQTFELNVFFSRR